MNTRKKVLLIAASAASAFTLGIGPATATSNPDIGDGKLSCNNGEICLAKDKDKRHQKHFSPTSRNKGHVSHDNFYFVDVKTGKKDAKLRDNVYAVRNSTKCDIKIVDDRGWYRDDVQTVPNDGEWHTLKSSVRDQNDRHEWIC